MPVPEEWYGKVALFAMPGAESTAKQMMKLAPDKFVLGKLNRPKFPDKNPNYGIAIESIPLVTNKDVVVVLSATHLAALKDQLDFVSVLARGYCRALTITVICPYWPTGTDERVDPNDPGHLSGFKTSMRDCAKLPQPQMSHINIVIADLHQLQEQLQFPDNTMPILLSAVPKFAETIDDDTIVLFPDEGAEKRFGMYFKKNVYACSKKRKGDERIIKLPAGVNFKGKKVVIIDDILNSCGTIITVIKALKAKGVGKVQVFATHSVCPKQSYKKLIGMANKVTVTNSIPKVAIKMRKLDPKIFKVQSLAPDFARIALAQRRNIYS